MHGLACNTIDTANMLQEAAREREIEERERTLGALMAEKGASSQKKKTSKVCRLRCGMPCQALYSQQQAVTQLHSHLAILQCKG